MKQVLIIGMLVVFGLTAWLCSDFVFQKEYLALISDGEKTITLENKKGLSEEGIVQYLAESASSSQVAVEVRIPEDSAARRSADVFDVSIYTMNYNRFSNLLENGRFPSAIGEYVSSDFTQSSLQTGQIKLASPQYTLNIYPFHSLLNNVNNAEYQIFYEELSHYNEFKALLASQGLIVEERDSSLPNRIITDDIQTRLVVFLAFWVVVGISILYCVVLSSKHIGVYKLLGGSTVGIVVNILKTYALMPFLMSIGTLSVLIFSLTIVFGRVYIFSTIFISWLGAVLFISMVSLLALFPISALIVHKISAQCLFKHKKPFRIVAIVNVAAKSILSLFLAVTFLGALQNAVSLGFLYAQKNDWDILKRYVTFPVFTKDSTLDYNLGLMSKKLYTSINSKGGILMMPDDSLIMPEGFSGGDEWAYDVNHPYFWRNNGVKINSNYLQVNPIYDTAGTPIQLDGFEKEDYLILLVPEKYKEYEEILYRDFRETYTFSYYAAEDYKMMNQESKEAPNRNLRDIIIIYTANEQTYRLLNPLYSINNTNYLVDPIGLVVNDVNYGGDTYLAAISKGDLLAPVQNTEDPYISYGLDIDKAGLSNNIFTVKNAYDSVEKIHEDIRIELYEQALLILISGILLIVIILYSNLCFFEADKQLFALEMMMGYTLMRRCRKVLILAGVFWVCICCILTMVLRFNFFEAMVLSSLSFLIEASFVLIIASKIKPNPQRIWGGH